MTSQRKLLKARRKAQKSARKLALMEASSANAARTASPHSATGPVVSSLAPPSTYNGPPASPGAYTALPHARARTAETGKRRRRSALVVLATLVVIAGIAAGAWFGYLEERFEDEPTETSATISIEDVRGIGEAIVVRDGSVGVEALAAVEAIGDRFVYDGSVAVLRSPLLVDTTGSFDVAGVELRMASGAGDATYIEVRGGDLDVHDSTLTSWDESTGAVDEDIDDGRASVLVTAGGSATVRSSRLVSLGHGETDRHGFSFTGGSTSGSIVDTEIAGSHAGVTVSGDVDVKLRNLDISDVTVSGIELAGTTGVRVSDSVVQASAGDGITVLGGSADIVIHDNDVFGNEGTGLALVGSSGKIEVYDNLSHRNGRAGVTVSNTRDVVIRDNKVWGNLVGVSLVGGNSGTDVRRNTIGGNRNAGVESTSAGNTVLIRDNVIDHNEHGVVVADGTVEVRGNRIEDNTFGVAVLDKSPRAVVRDNDILNSAEGGIRFVTVDGIEIDGNTVNGNRMAPFVVDVVDQSLAFHDSNDVQSGRKGLEWVYEPMRDIGELAVIEPVPAEFFTQPNVEFLIPEEPAR
jgi:parallel beta-helix repeat protein